MNLQAGQTLGKYELIEKVGQGGMAVVYRARDPSLERMVAVKVLHHHLTENREARARFAREAHAVAKLRHENILEIHDFSGLEEEAAFIVTEFIEGCTLKEFIVEHPIDHPEVGALIVVQVCRALAAAHASGVLHRDVKPENIMIRNDGVVKLMDFGIAQMLDQNRMTVTGQLLGSPAYMSPEHIRGGRLDFRTDVFAVGIVLYQIITGELPFRGNNPHEILKKIAECDYQAPERANQRVGNDLGRIVRKALSREPEHRYSDIALMQTALERFAKDSGLHAFQEELERFFSAPAAYQIALHTRLVDHLSARAEELAPKNKVAALELYNRVLSLEPHHERTLNGLRHIGRSKHRTIGLWVLTVGALAVGALFLTTRLPKATVNIDPDAGNLGDNLFIDARPARDASLTIDAGVVDDAAPEQLADAAIARPTPPGRANRPPTSDTSAPERVSPPLRPRTFRLHLTPRGSEYRVDQGPWQAASDGRATVEVMSESATIYARNLSCCQESAINIDSDTNEGKLELNLSFLPAQVTPRCGTPGVRVQVGGKLTRLGRPATIPITRLVGPELVEVRFISDTAVDEHTLSVRAKESTEVLCRFDR